MDNFNLKKFLKESKLIKEDVSDYLKPLSQDEKLLSSPIISKDTKGNDIELIGQEGDKIFWDANGKRYSKVGSDVYMQYSMDREDAIKFSKEKSKTNHYLTKYSSKEVNEALNLDPSSPQIGQYWDIMVKNQPEDVIKTLTDLTAGRLSFKDFLDTTEEDVFDSFRDDE
jgi:hypothetical protein